MAIWSVTTKFAMAPPSRPFDTDKTLIAGPISDKWHVVYIEVYENMQKSGLVSLSYR